MTAGRRRRRQRPTVGTRQPTAIDLHIGGRLIRCDLPGDLPATAVCTCFGGGSSEPSEAYIEPGGAY